MARSKKGELHPTQKRLLSLLRETIDEPLSMRELQEELGLSAPNLVHHHVTQLEKKGYLLRNPGNSRDYQILSDPIQKAIAYVNRYGLAQCGPSGSILDGNPIERIPVPIRLLGFPPDRAFIVQARGSSMVPRIHNGDIVIAEKAQAANDGDIVVCVNEGSPLIKVIRKLDSGICLLESLNPDFKPIEIGREFNIEGKVRVVMSSL